MCLPTFRIFLRYVFITVTVPLEILNLPPASVQFTWYILCVNVSAKHIDNICGFQSVYLNDIHVP